MYIYSNTAAGLLFVETEKKMDAWRILDGEGTEVSCPVMGVREENGKVLCTLDARNLKPWSVEQPQLYTLEADGESVRFGHMSIRSFQNKQVLLNDAPVYLRGYIRGITAHDHPNMTGLSDYEAARKNILQAKKYGFNLVRFHSTVPSEDFVRAADELGLLIHMEIGFAYDYDDQGHKKNLAINNEKWSATIMRFRNHPSLAIFCIGNELHNAGRYPEVRTMYEQGKSLAPNKLILDNSGWGEYDRFTADIFCQHIAYFFPYAHHGNMFNEDAPWKMNASAYYAPQEAAGETNAASVTVKRESVPIRPTLSHEAMHYIDIPDYDALNEKFDAFAARVGQEYLEKHGIKKPRYLTELPRLIARKGLTDLMTDYRRASRHWKKMAMKVFLEKLRLSNLCGYEMLQFSDCLKYENKNGLVDFFDDDKGFDAAWLRQMNDDLTLLMDTAVPCCTEGDIVKVEIYASDFLPQPEIMGTLTVKLDGETIYTGEKFVLAGGLQKLATLNLTMKETGVHELSAGFVSDEVSARNEWTLWVYPAAVRPARPEMHIRDGALRDYLAASERESDIYLTDALDESLLAALDTGRTAVLLYEHNSPRNTWQMQGALERFKPCIWDRGSNLGGVIRNEKVAAAVQGELFDLNMQPLVEAGYKVNLDEFPIRPCEHVLGVDKPVRDRMKGLINGVKDFIDQDTLRRFSHLFSLKAGKGQLIVCTFNLSAPENPVTAAFLHCLLDDTQALYAENGLGTDEFRAWLEKINREGIRKEDVMNHFWEIDNKPVEDTLFWEEAKINLAQMRDSSDK